MWLPRNRVVVSSNKVYRYTNSSRISASRITGSPRCDPWWRRALEFVERPQLVRESKKRTPSMITACLYAYIREYSTPVRLHPRTTCLRAGIRTQSVDTSCVHRDGKPGRDTRNLLQRFHRYGTVERRRHAVRYATIHPSSLPLRAPPPILVRVAGTGIPTTPGKSPRPPGAFGSHAQPISPLVIGIPHVIIYLVIQRTPPIYLETGIFGRRLVTDSMQLRMRQRVITSRVRSSHPRRRRGWSLGARGRWT